LKIIVLKLGSNGCAIYSRNNKLSIPAYKIIERDPTGAGDCFDAGFICGLLENHNLEECAKIASAVGAINASAFGPMEGKISRMDVARMTGIKL
jgi:sugar/nucleoside kinase (ribokinase family)